MLFAKAVALAFALPVLRAAVVPTTHETHGHDHIDDMPKLPGVWYQEPNHPVHSLFRRAAPDDGTPYPAVGTPEWAAGFPNPAAGVPDHNTIPASWIAALNEAVSEGKIPNVPVTTNTPNTSPVYPTGVDPMSPQVCSATYRCRIPGDIWDAPPGIYASSFDDGPLPPTPQLVDFLGTNSLTTSFFMIGTNILYYPTQFLAAFNAGHHIGVHTWTHPYMTTLSNLDVLAQLGWTMQLIHNSTGGRVPRYWRPPYGDSDLRVRSIALEVFGLETVIWNSDSSDWSANSPQQVVDTITGYITGPKTPGLVLLEHTNSAITVGGFMTVYPAIIANGWAFRSVMDVANDDTIYQNANSSTSSVTPMGVLPHLVSSSSVASTTTATSATFTSSLRRASPTSSTSTKKSSAISWHVPSALGLVLLSGLSVLIS